MRLHRLEQAVMHHHQPLEELVRSHLVVGAAVLLAVAVEEHSMAEAEHIPVIFFTLVGTYHIYREKNQQKRAGGAEKSNPSGCNKDEKRRLTAMAL
jgi:hypothetical protein